MKEKEKVINVKEVIDEKEHENNNHNSNGIDENMIANKVSEIIKGMNLGDMIKSQIESAMPKKEEIKEVPKNDVKEQYDALFNDLKFKHESDFREKKEKMIEKYGLDSGDFEGMTSLANLDSLEKIVSKTHKKVSKEALNETNVKGYLKDKVSIIHDLADEIKSEAQRAKTSPTETLSKFKTFFNKK